MPVRWISYFGYGSLVNRDTRPINEAATDVRLRGWRRVWSHRVGSTNERSTCCTSLTVEPIEEFPMSSTDGIDGVLVKIKIDDLPALDLRESGYERVALSAACFDLPEGLETDEIMVYRSLPHNRHMAERDYPILQSYIDCVMAGYRRRFGEDGLCQMISTTHGWERSILDDRSDPFYPRHVLLDADQQRYFDGLLGEHLKAYSGGASQAP